jgi:putative hydrolases of HD superfamily
MRRSTAGTWRSWPWCLAEHADEGISLLRVLQLVLVHDMVEIDAGDTYLYDEAGNNDKAEREERAAARIFGLLPPDQGKALYELWQEFEARETADARFANALDRLMPLLHNYHTGGRAWKEHGIRGDQVRQRLATMGDGSSGLWAYAQTIIEAAIAEGLLGS